MAGGGGEITLGLTIKRYYATLGFLVVMSVLIRAVFSKKCAGKYWHDDREEACKMNGK